MSTTAGGPAVAAALLLTAGTVICLAPAISLSSWDLL